MFAGWEPLGCNAVNPSLSMDYSVTAIKNNCQDIDAVRVKVIKSISAHSDHVQIKFIDKINWFRISINPSISEEFIREFKDKVIWKMVSQNHFNHPIVYLKPAK